MGSSSRFLTGHRLADHQVLHHISSGGMGDVCVARKIGRRGRSSLVALKIPHPHLASDPRYVSMLLDEAAVTRRSDHPNVVKTLGFRTDARHGFHIVMEHVEGVSLGALLSHARKSRRELPAPVCLRILRDVLSGLAAAHAATGEDGKPLSLVHRDVCPSNIHVGSDGRTRLLDFGIADAKGRRCDSREGFVLGKLSYMAPERVFSKGADSRMDLFSCGAVLRESFSGERLFSGTDVDRIGEELGASPQRIAQLSGPLRPLVGLLRIAVSVEPEHRFQSAAEFIAGIDEIAPQVGGVATHHEVADTVDAIAGDRLRADLARISASVRRLDTLRRSPKSSPIASIWATPGGRRRPDGGHSYSNGA
ncbi:MAG: serine/threonine protein kinase [Polyangiaceae bacterium]|nr:serine/threonine protein kinase [Polyangiaceae bacterium]